MLFMVFYIPDICLFAMENMLDLHPNHKILVHFLRNVSEQWIQVHSICMKT